MRNQGAIEVQVALKMAASFYCGYAVVHLGPDRLHHGEPDWSKSALKCDVKSDFSFKIMSIVIRMVDS